MGYEDAGGTLVGRRRWAARNTGLGLSPDGTGYTGPDPEAGGVQQAEPPELPQGISDLPGLRWPLGPGSGTPLQFGNDAHNPVGSLLVAGLSTA